MALLVSLRSRLGSSGSEDPAPKEALTDALESLRQENLPIEAFGERAVELVRAKAAVTAVALLKSNPRNNRMQVLASTGLEDDAVRALEGAGPGRVWEIPAHAVANRRIHVIEAAHKNPFVPRPIVALAPRRLQIAIVPFYHRGEGAGVLALFSASSQPFSDALIHSVARGVRVLAPVVAGAPAAATTERTDHGGLLQGLGSLREERDELRRALEEAERRAAEQAAERVSAESFLRAEQDRAAELQTELDGLRKQLEDLDSRKGASESRTEELTKRIRELEAHLEEERSTFARERSGLEEELAGLRSELAATAEQRQALEGQARELEARTRELQERLDDTGKRLAAVEEQKTVVEQRLDDAERRARDGSAAGEELQKLREELREVSAAREQAEARAGDLENRLDETARKVETIETERNALEERLTSVETAASDRSAAEERLQEVRRELEGKLEEAAREAEHLRGELAEREGLLRELEARLADSPEEPIKLVPEEEELPIDRSGAAGEVDSGEELDIEKLPSGFEVYVIDGDSSAGTVIEHLSRDGLEARRPDGAIPVSAGSVLVNLAAAEAAPVLAELADRPEPLAAPIYGYVLAESGKGKWLGRIELARRDCASDVVAGRLTGFGGAIRRVLTVSSDPELMSKLREELRGHRMSAAVVLDAKQALDLVGAVRPDAAVVHLCAKATGLLDTVADLQREGPGRELPTVLLLEKNGFPTDQIGKLAQKCDTPEEELLAAFENVLGLSQEAA